LLLLKDEDIPTDIRESEYLQDARKKLREHPVYQADGVVDLVARFLGDMWGVILKDINKAMSEDVVDNLPLRIAITVPAIWPSYARQKMKQAAERAGILSRKSKAETTLVIVEEPEAAALCTFFERRNYPDIEVSHIMRGASPVPIPPNSGLLTDQVGEAFVVCDCGGGTAVSSGTVTCIPSSNQSSRQTGYHKLHRDKDGAFSNRGGCQRRRFVGAPRTPSWALG